MVSQLSEQPREIALNATTLHAYVGSSIILIAREGMQSSFSLTRDVIPDEESDSVPVQFGLVILIRMGNLELRWLAGSLSCAMRGMFRDLWRGLDPALAII